MSYRERREARAARLREWADSRDRKAEAAEQRTRSLVDVIPFGQPILVGHHSESRHRRDLARIEGGLRRRHEHASKAEGFRTRAATIEAQAEHAIYSDDDDATERLEQRVAELEAKRDRIKTYNASCRRGTPDPSGLTDDERASLASVLRHAPYQSKGSAFPGYVLTNLSGNIGRQRKRLDTLRRQAVEGGPHG
jgi:Domain of unknown function (DUF3560)